MKTVYLGPELFRARHPDDPTPRVEVIYSAPIAVWSLWINWRPDVHTDHAEPGTEAWMIALGDGEANRFATVLEDAVDKLKEMNFCAMWPEAYGNIEAWLACPSPAGTKGFYYMACPADREVCIFHGGVHVNWSNDGTGCPGRKAAGSGPADRPLAPAADASFHPEDRVPGSGPRPGELEAESEEAGDGGCRG